MFDNNFSTYAGKRITISYPIKTKTLCHGYKKHRKKKCHQKYFLYEYVDILKDDEILYNGTMITMNSKTYIKLQKELKYGKT